MCCEYTEKGVAMHTVVTATAEPRGGVGVHYVDELSRCKRGTVNLRQAGREARPLNAPQSTAATCRLETRPCGSAPPTFLLQSVVYGRCGTAHSNHVEMTAVSRSALAMAQHYYYHHHHHYHHPDHYHHPPPTTHHRGKDSHLHLCGLCLHGICDRDFV